MEIKRGDIYFADLGEANVGSEQAGFRPVIIIQNDIGNRFSPTVIVACVTSKTFKNSIPTHVLIDGASYGLEEDSLILCEQVKTLDKTRIRFKVASLNEYDIGRLNRALRLSLNL